MEHLSVQNIRKQIITIFGKRWAMHVVHILIALVLFCLFISIVYWRFPESYRYPNFYAEDGSVYLQNIIDNGFLHSFFSIFNGYFVVGLYLVEGFALFLNHILFGNHFIHLPQSFALASFSFMALCATLPYILLRRYWGKLVSVGLGLAMVLVPLPHTTHVVIGTIGNLKWLFFVLACILAIYRFYASARIGKKVILVDVTLLICGYTNVTSYLVLPLILWPYLPQIYNALCSYMKKHDTASFVKLIKAPGFMSLLVLGLVLLVQLVYIKIHGIPKIPGYLDTSFDYRQFIEVYIGRTIDFTFLHPIYEHVNNLLSILGFIGLSALCAVIIRGKDRVVALFSIFAAIIATAAFTLNRPGISDQLHSYQTSGPDQFFYGQNMVVYISIFILLSSLIRRFKKDIFGKTLLMILFGLFIGANYLSAVHFRSNNVMESMTGTYEENVAAACAKPHNAYIRTQNYPLPGTNFVTQIASTRVCDAYLLAHYSATVIPTGTYARGNFIALTTKPLFYQNFTATGDKLDGISVFISTFQQKTLANRYTLYLYDASCKQIIRQAPMGFEVFDNTYYRIHFAEIAQSKGKTYCFTIKASEVIPQSLAVQLSQPSIYNTGLLKLNGRTQETDIVFDPIYDPYH